MMAHMNDQAISSKARGERALFPMALVPRPGLTARFCVCAFPSELKRRLAPLVGSDHPERSWNFRGLKELCEAWLPGFVALNPIKAQSDDSCWLWSLTEVDAQRLRAIVGYWLDSRSQVASPLKAAKKRNDDALEYRRICLELPPDLFDGRARWIDAPLPQQSDRLCIPFPSLETFLAKQLVGKQVTVSDESLRLLSAGPRALITEPACGELGPYALGIELTGQTFALGDVERASDIRLRTRRFVPRLQAPRENPLFSKDGFATLVRMDNERFTTIRIDWEKGVGPRWSEPGKTLFYQTGGAHLPEAAHLLRHPEEYVVGNDAYPQILLPYKVGLDSGGSVTPKVGTGVSFGDKKDIMEALASLLEPWVLPMGPLKPRCRARSLVPTVDTDAERFARGLGGHEARFELWYPHSEEPLANMLEQEIQAFMLENFGTQAPDQVRVEVERMGTPWFTDGLAIEQLKIHDAYKMRCEHIASDLSRAERPTVAIVVLPGASAWKKNPGSDPKSAIRRGLALTGRASQFIEPFRQNDAASRRTAGIEAPMSLGDGGNVMSTDPTARHRAHEAVRDAFRQLGFTPKLLRAGQRDTAFDRLIAAEDLVLCVQRRYKQQVPFRISIDYASGEMQVSCPPLNGARPMTYFNAQIRCAEATQDAKAFFERCRRHMAREQGGIPPNLSGDISRAIYLVCDDGRAPNGYWARTTDATLRSMGSPIAGAPYPVFRVRAQRVPDYGTPQKPNGTFSVPSGLYALDGITWSVANKPNDPEYNACAKKSRLLEPRVDFNHSRQLELCPLALPEGCDEELVLSDIHALRRHMPQVSDMRPAKLPAPIHLLECLRNYLNC